MSLHNKTQANTIWTAEALDSRSLRLEFVQRPKSHCPWGRARAWLHFQKGLPSLCYVTQTSLGHHHHASPDSQLLWGRRPSLTGTPLLLPTPCSHAGHKLFFPWAQTSPQACAQAQAHGLLPFPQALLPSPRTRQCCSSLLSPSENFSQEIFH